VKRRIAWLVAAGLMAAAPAWAQVPPAELNSATAIAAGHDLFNRRCAGKCHGLDGYQGEDAPAVRGKDHLLPPYVYAVITTGRAGSAMPSWKERLSEEELWQVVAYVVSLNKQ